MKKIIAAIAALCLCGMLTACGNSAASDNNVSTSVSETTSAETTIIATETTAVTDKSEETPTTTEETASPEETSAPDPVTVSETTISEETTGETSTATAVETEAEKEPAEEEIVIDNSAEEFTVNSKFADMDDFLASDIFMLDGKTVTADKSLSANIFNTFNGDFYLKTSNFDGSSPFEFAVKGNMIMTESKTDGKANKMVIRDSKAYTFDHENKVALFLPAEKELTSQYSPEKMGIIPENVAKESFVIADVTIGGKAYKFEYGTTSDWAMLYDSGNKLYASVRSDDSLDCVLCKFSVTSKIPSGTFDIPEDYFQLDLEKMMQNAPPSENVE